MKENKKYSRKLDEQANVFALTSSEKYCSIFRFSAELKEKVDSNILKESLNITLEKYKAYKVRLKEGFFSFYLEENEKEPIIFEEEKTEFKKINTKENNDYLFKVTYFDNKIYVQFFHALTDGNGGVKFFKDLVCNYLKLKNNITDSNEDSVVIEDTEDAYLKVYKEFTGKGDKVKFAYRIKGTDFEDDRIEVNNLSIDLNLLKNVSKEKDVSLSVFVIALIVYSIYETNYLNNNDKRPVNLNVPIDLNRYFETNTISNFFSYVTLDFVFDENKKYTFNDILKIAHEKYLYKVQKDYFMNNISANIRKTNSTFIKMIPLKIKHPAFRLGSRFIKKTFSMTISNMGKIEIDDVYKEYVDKMYITLVPDWVEKIKIGISSFENNLVISFGRKIKETFIQDKIKELLKENNITFVEFN